MKAWKGKSGVTQAIYLGHPGFPREPSWAGLVLSLVVWLVMCLLRMTVFEMGASAIKSVMTGI